MSNILAGVGASAEFTKDFLVAQKSFPKITTDKKATVRNQKGAGYSYSYASLKAINEALLPKLHENGFVVLHPFGFTEDSKPTVKTILLHRSGGFIESEVPIPEQGDMQSLGKWISYLRRFGLAAICGIVTEDAETMGGEDDDPILGSKPSAPLAPAPREVEKPRDVEKPTFVRSTLTGTDVEKDLNLVAGDISALTGENAGDVIYNASAFKGSDGKEVGFRSPAGKSLKWVAGTLKTLNKRLNDLVLTKEVGDVPF